MATIAPGVSKKQKAMKREELKAFTEWHDKEVGVNRSEGWDKVIDNYLSSLSPTPQPSATAEEPMTKEEILEDTTRCTINDDDDLDVPENFYFKYNDVLEAMERYAQQTRGTADGSIGIERAKKYAAHQHYRGTINEPLVEFEDWEVKV